MNGENVDDTEYYGNRNGLGKNHQNTLDSRENNDSQNYYINSDRGSKRYQQGGGTARNEHSFTTQNSSDFKLENDISSSASYVSAVPSINENDYRNDFIIDTINHYIGEKNSNNNNSNSNNNSCNSNNSINIYDDDGNIQNNSSSNSFRSHNNYASDSNIPHSVAIIDEDEKGDKSENTNSDSDFTVTSQSDSSEWTVNSCEKKIDNFRSSPTFTDDSDIYYSFVASEMLETSDDKICKSSLPSDRDVEVKTGSDWDNVYSREYSDES
eukprot:Awhi_evm1s13603